MLKKTLTTLVIAGLTGAAGLAFGLESAAATPLAGYTGMAKASDSYIQPVRWVYVEGRHGARYRYKHGGYRYYYGGYWYDQPYWEVHGVRSGRVSCGEGREIVAERFNRVRVIECNGGTYTYLGRRGGDAFRILLNSRTGRIVGRTMI